MTVTEAAATARLDALITRIQRETDDDITRDDAFALCVGRRWLRRVGADGPEAEYHTLSQGRRLGWQITSRGHVVAREEAEGT